MTATLTAIVNGHKQSQIDEPVPGIIRSYVANATNERCRACPTPGCPQCEGGHKAKREAEATLFSVDCQTFFTCGITQEPSRIDGGLSSGQ